ncbi:energy transducer TonB, partial [Sphingomonas jeddahensis]
PPPHVEPPPRTTSSRPEGRASAPNLRSRAAPIAAPEPIVLFPPPPPPVIAAPKPYVANDNMSGSADIRGPGTGAGGVGDGFGSGGAGDGDGGGYGEETGPTFLRGRMSTSDLPEALFATGFVGTVGVRYLVATNGRVPECVVTRSSGNRQVDAVTCRLIRERFRFRPSRDGRGRPVSAWIVENHSWEVEADTNEITETTRRRRTRLW